jgi:tRNA dimethylallyltransferase
VATEALHARLAAADPQGAASIPKGDRARILRALEVVTTTGRPLSAWQRTDPMPPLVDPASAVRIVLAPDRATVHRRIAERAERTAMACLAEVEALLRLALDPELPVMKAIGVREFADHIRGDTSLDEAIAAIKTETRRYAKRQMTWFRGQMAGWRWIDDPARLDLDALAA